MNAEHDGPRIPPPVAAQWSDAQKAAAARVLSSRGGAMRGPFGVMLWVPELLDRAQHLGEYLRLQCSIPVDLRELAILAAARHWRQEYEWQVHAPLAVASGVEAAVVEAVRAGRRPRGLRREQRAVLDFCRQLHRKHGVDDAVFEAARAVLGREGVVELCALCGYYAMLAMLLNVAGTPPPRPAEAVFDR
ncbi:MAG: carboxymuconolactone decarboxylase family protein [Pseudoxanthomonas sp.]